MTRPLFDADYSAIEARIVCWLAGQEDALQEYRDGIDRYKVMASMIYGVPYDQVNKFPQRFVGKEAILMCGFQGGGDKVRRSCEKKGYKELPIGMEHIITKFYRTKHNRVKSSWYDVERAAQKAIASKGKIFKVTDSKGIPYKVPVSFLHEDISGIPFLLLKLPSGRKLAYPRPRLIPSPKFEGKLQIVFFGKIGMTVNWGDCDTYGGKLVENITQAVASDIMCEGAYNAEQAGFPIMALIHDQALSYSTPELIEMGAAWVECPKNLTADGFVKCLTSMPAWADGLPIEAEGGEVPFYKKD